MHDAFKCEGITWREMETHSEEGNLWHLPSALFSCKPSEQRYRCSLVGSGWCQERVAQSPFDRQSAGLIQPICVLSKPPGTRAPRLCCLCRSRTGSAVLVTFTPQGTLR